MATTDIESASVHGESRILRRSPLIEPIYSQSSPNEPLALGQVAVQLGNKGTAYQDVASIVIRFAPNNRLEIICPFQDKGPLNTIVCGK